MVATARVNVNYVFENYVLSLITGYADYLSAHAYVCISRHPVLPHSPFFLFSFLVACSDPFAHLLFDYLPS